MLASHNLYLLNKKSVVLLHRFTINKYQLFYTNAINRHSLQFYNTVCL